MVGNGKNGNSGNSGSASAPRRPQLSSGLSTPSPPRSRWSNLLLVGRLAMIVTLLTLALSEGMLDAAMPAGASAQKTGPAVPAVSLAAGPASPSPRLVPSS